MGYLAKLFFGTENSRQLKKYQAKVSEINELESSMEKLSDSDLKNKTEEFKQRLLKGETLDDILVHAFAVVREAAKRVLGQRHYDVQLIGGMVLHDGKITEMKTGEGKTLVATLPIYLNALSGKGVHLITVNDYLAKRDAETMGKVYNFLGLSVGCILNEYDDEERQKAYACDITYGTNHEFGFDYLRDNMEFRKEALVQRPFNYAIVDEVDSILIDEARTPLIISGAAEGTADAYNKINELIPLLKQEHYKIDEKEKSATFTEAGMQFIEGILYDRGLIYTRNLYDISNATVVHHLDKCLTAHKLYKKDVDYLVKDNQVYIIDEFTGRIMEGRRYSDGLHQALEAKEGVDVREESQTLASITYQNYFRLYPKLAGMTGTALTEAQEFDEIYKLACIDVPTNLPVRRIDYNDEVYLTEGEKYEAIVKLVKECHSKNQPVLIGTVSIEKSEKLNSFLKAEGIKAQVLNAKYHEKEAYIIAEAGVPGTITIATNMAGRGTDIQLGGNYDMRVKQELDGVTDEKEIEEKQKQIKEDIEKKKKIALEAGGLYVIGTERHESRRIDNQLRGRTGRQGDPGASKFFLSMEDDLMRIFGGDRMKGMLSKMGLKRGEAIIHPWVTRALEKAQMKVEAHNFSIRKNLLKYDDIMNEQRKIIYNQRREIMFADDVSSHINDMVNDVVEDIVNKYIPERSLMDHWDLDGLSVSCEEHFGIKMNFNEYIALNTLATPQDIFFFVRDAVVNLISEKENLYGKDSMVFAKKSIFLQQLDIVWKEHLAALDFLKQGIGLRAYGQRDPLNEYKREAFIKFEDNMMKIKYKTVETVCHVSFVPNEDVTCITDGEENLDSKKKSVKKKIKAEKKPKKVVEEGKDEFSSDVVVSNVSVDNAKGIDSNISRNALCPCGSGLKYKHCCGKLV